MGVEPHAAVVDRNLRSFKVPNLWIASTSAFPSGGGENPTLTLILFTLRLADHLGSRINPA
jgi:choline dehydrogenase-like flavoprotein